ncbi:hypothetical protein AL755_02095 (plasmid) [Arthrobacter sp. ERGS1:01]|uniref:hypothetical protein n=1 Tax=Arthrobacter sp. ERGS1:01 TaxID=1704044 RepID=UPI0006B68DEB|nr:hypothetical protein [Arthrobacter sp. ERGS1:01]ALE04490.1 hypothetical protein AL755_02095 [Arthrobacter sp. ERGS1:01]
MSAGTLEATRAGHTSISAGTMTRLAAAIAADAFKVPLRDVRAGVRDGQGQLSVSLALALAITPFSEIARTPRDPDNNRNPGVGTVFQRADAARAVIARRMQELAGSSVGRVDIRFTGVQMESRERVQ